MVPAVQVQVFVAPKPSELPSSCQDVAQVDLNLNGSGEVGFVVCDGVTGGWDGQLWAELVCEETMKVLPGLTSVPLTSWLRVYLSAALDSARSRWGTLNAHLGQSDDPIDALAHAKFVSTGGQTTLLAGVLTPEPRVDVCSLTVLHIGDSNLFVLRPLGETYELRASVPIEKSDQFDSFPHTVMSKSSGHDQIARGVTVSTLSDLLPGDVVIAATDGISQWALYRHEQGAAVWDLLARMNSTVFDEVLGRVRGAREMASDDVLAVRIALNGLTGTGMIA